MLFLRGELRWWWFWLCEEDGRDGGGGKLIFISLGCLGGWGFLEFFG